MALLGALAEIVPQPLLDDLGETVELRSPDRRRPPIPRRNRWRLVRGLCRPGSAPDPSARRRGDHGQPLQPQARLGEGDDRGKGSEVEIPSALQPVFQSYRDGLLQAQGAAAKGRRAQRRRPLGRHRTLGRCLHPPRMRQLLRCRRI